MKKLIYKTISALLSVSVAMSAIMTAGITAYADDAYTVHFFNTMEESTTTVGTISNHTDRQSVDPTTYQTYLANDIQPANDDYADVAGYGKMYKIYYRDANKVGIDINFGTAVPIADDNQYAELEFDYRNTGNAMKFRFNKNTNILSGDMSGTDFKVKFDGDSSDTTIGFAAKDDLARFKFTFRTTEKEGKRYWQICSLKINGAEKFTDGKTVTVNVADADMNSFKLRYGNASAAQVYIDNISVVSYISADGISPAPDRYPLLAKLKTVQKNFEDSKAAGIVPADVEDTVITNAEQVFIKQNVTSEELEQGMDSLDSVNSMVEAYKYMDTNNTTYYVDGADISETGDFSTNDLTVSTPIYTVALETPVTIKALGFLYADDPDLHTPRLLEIVPVEKTVNANSSDSIDVDFDTSAYTSYSNFSAKVGVSENYADIASEIPAVYHATKDDLAVGEGYSFVSDVNVSKELLNDDPGTEDFKVIFALKGNAGSKVSLLVAKPNVEIEDIADLDTQSTAAPSSMIEYYNTVVFDENGKAVIEFVPTSGMDYYNYVINCADYAAPKTSDIFYASLGDINTIFTKLYSEESLDDVTTQQKDAISINTSVYDDAVTAGVNMDNVLMETLGEKTYNAYNLSEFTTSILTKLDLLTKFRTTDSADTVMTLIEDNASKIEKASDVTSLSSKNKQTAYSYINTNKAGIVDMATLNSTFTSAAAYAISTNSQQNPPLGGGGGGGGGGGANKYTPPIVTEGFEGNNNNKPESPSETQTVMQNANTLFSDLDSVSWAKTAILEFAVNGWINGKAEGIFAPSDKITREEFVKIAVNIFGFYDENANCSFTDTSVGDWHYSYIASAFVNELVNGITETEFGTGMPITRQDMAVLVYRIAKAAGLVLTEDGEYIPFADEELISDYAKEAVIALTKSGVINGADNNSFLPDGIATRAEAAKMLYEAYKLK